MSATEQYLANNVRYAETFSGPLPMPPAAHLAVVACMDARLNVYGMLGLGEGEAHVIRNAGGVVTDDQIRSLAISQRLLGTKEIVLVHHTDCGMLTFTRRVPRSSGRDGDQARLVTGPSVTSAKTSASPSPDQGQPFIPHTDAIAGSSSTSPPGSSTRSSEPPAGRSDGPRGEDCKQEGGQGETPWLAGMSAAAAPWSAAGPGRRRWPAPPRPACWQRRIGERVRDVLSVSLLAGTSSAGAAGWPRNVTRPRCRGWERRQQGDRGQARSRA
jgi:carbonic anhydrase